MSAGAVVQYSIDIVNTGNVALRSVNINAPTLAALECGTVSIPFILGVGKRITCKASYRFKHADLQQGSDKVHSLQVTSEGATAQTADVTVKMAYGCDTCSACINQFAGATRKCLVLAGSASDIAKGIGAFCRSTNRTDSSCEALQAYINATAAGRAGLRAGAVCQVLKECILDSNVTSTRPGSCSSPSAQTTNLQGQPVNGSVDLCTVQGVATGDLIPGFTKTMGECPASEQPVSTPSWHQPSHGCHAEGSYSHQ